MRAKLGANKVVLQFGSMSVAADQSSVIATDPAIDSTINVGVVMTPHTNVSITPHKQTNDIFLVITSDTSGGTAEYLIASTS